MPFVERDQEIEAFPPDGPDESLAEGVRLGRVKGVFRTLTPIDLTAESSPGE